MNKKYTIEVPIYSSPIEHLIELNRSNDINIVMYGGVPNSPLNGGRPNYCLDGLMLWSRPSLRATEKQLLKALSNFHGVITKANQNGIPFFIAFTNMFVGNGELNEENLYPVKQLVESSQKYGVKNGLILNNKFLEKFIRQKYEDKLVYVSSCTKYVSSDKILTPRETLGMYLKDIGKYDFVVLTPQDSRREKLIEDVLRASKDRIIAICNSYCANCCNCYHHYKYLSEENKKSLLDISTVDILNGAITSFVRLAPKCFVLHHPLAFRRVHLEKIARMQLNAGIVNFKLGRGLGAAFLDRLVTLISEFKQTPSTNS